MLFLQKTPIFFVNSRGFQTRKKKVESPPHDSNNDDEEMPDLKCPGVAKAAVNIQRVYRGFQTRKKLRETTTTSTTTTSRPAHSE